jgi:hypothetical protein
MASSFDYSINGVYKDAASDQASCLNAVTASISGNLSVLQACFSSSYAMSLRALAHFACAGGKAVDISRWVKMAWM